MIQKEEMDEKLLRYLLNESDEEECRFVQQWLEKEETNRYYFKRFQLTHLELFWEVHAPFVKEDYKHFKNRLHRRKLLRRLTRIAASVAIVFTVGWSVWQTFTGDRMMSKIEIRDSIQPGKPQAMLFLASGESFMLEAKKTELQEKDGTAIKVDESGMIAYADLGGNVDREELINRIKVPRGGEFTVVLIDGTKIWLNADSELEYPVSFKGEERAVHLKGEGYFQVAKDTIHPFIVHVNGLKVKVYGTQFNLNARLQDKVEAVLVEGKISMVYSGKEVNIRPNQKGTYDGRQIRVEEVDVLPYISWKNGDFIFKNESMETIMDKLSLWYDLQVFYANDRLREVRLSGNMKRYKEVIGLLRSFEKISEARFEIKGKTVIVKEEK